MKTRHRDGTTYGEDLVALAFEMPEDPAGGPSNEDPGSGGGDPGNGAGNEGDPQGQGADGQRQPISGSAGAWDFRIKRNGQEVQLTREDAMRLASMGNDYTQKMQELAKARRDHEARVRAFEAQQRPPANGGRPQTDEDRVARLEQQIQDERLDRIMRELESKHGDAFDRDVFLAEAARRGVGDWSELYSLAEEHVSGMGKRYDDRLSKLLSNPEHPLVKAHNQRIIDDYVRGKKTPTGKTLGGKPGSAPGGGAPPKPPTTPEERDALAEKILSELG